MRYKYKDDIENAVIDSPIDVDAEAFDELEEVYAKAKKLDKIAEITDVPINVKQDKTMIEINKIFNEYTR